MELANRRWPTVRTMRDVRGRVAIVILVTLLLALSNTIHANESAPSHLAEPVRIQNGMLDLTNREVRANTFALDGEWEFYWGQFIAPDAFNDPAFSETPLYMSVPGTWKGLNADGKVLPGDGFGTLRLRIQLADDSGPVGLYLKNIRSSYELWVNNKHVASQGTVSEQPMLARPQRQDVIVGLGQDSTTLDIVLHVTNFAFREGGVGASIILGDESRIVWDLQRSLALEMFLIASLLVIGLYHVGIWTLRPHDRHALFFGLFCLVIALRTSVMDQAPLTYVFPSLPWETSLKLEYLGFYLGLPLFMLFLRSLFQKEMSWRVVAPLITVCGLFSLLVIVTPARIHSHALAYFEIVAVIAFTYMTYALIRGVRRRREGARLILTGAAILFVVVIHDMLFFWRFLGIRALTPAAILCLVLAYSFLLSKRFSDEFERQRILTEENASLLNTVQHQVEQIKASRRLMNERDEKTRRQIAEMLHGTVQSRLLSAQHYLLAALQHLSLEASGGHGDPQSLQEAERAISKAREQIDHASRRDVREISHLLHPMLIRMGLLPAIHALLERFSEHLDVEVSVGDGFLSFQDRLGKDGVDQPVRLAVYRIIEEAMSNVVKHAGATKMEIFLDVLDENVGEVIVRDNGRGFSDGDQGSGLGLTMMATRIEELHGTLTIESAPESGTTIHIRVPFRGHVMDEDTFEGAPLEFGRLDVGTLAEGRNETAAGASEVWGNRWG